MHESMSAEGRGFFAEKENGWSGENRLAMFPRLRQKILPMLSDRRFPIAALVCSAGALLGGASVQAQAPAAPAGLDAQMIQKADQLAA